MADYFWANNGGNWNSTGAQGHWYQTSGGGVKWPGVPGPTDNAIFDANSGTGTCQIGGGGSGTCQNLYCNGYNGVGPTSITLTGGNASVLNVYGNVALSPNQIFAARQYPKVVMTGTANGSITTSGNTFGDLDINKTSGTVTLNDDLISIGNTQLNLIAGGLNANNKNVTFGSFYTGGTSARTLIMGTGTWTMTFEGEVTSVPINTWNVASTTGLTFDKGLSTIRLIHARNEPSSNFSVASGLRTALISSASRIDLVDISLFNTAAGQSGYVLIGNEVISYTSIDVANRQLIIGTRGYGGTTTLASIPAGTAVIGVMLGNTVLTAPMTAGVNAPISVANASLFPVSGVVYIGTEQIAYSGTNITTNQLGVTTVGTPTQSHSTNDPVYAYQAKNFYGGGLTYNKIVFGCFGYKIKNNIFGANTFASIQNSNTGFTWTATNNIYPGFQELVFESGLTNTVSTFTFTGTSAYLQQVYAATPGSQTTLSISPATTGWYVGTHSTNGGNNANLYYSAGVIDYINWKDVIGLPNIPPAPVVVIDTHDGEEKRKKQYQSELEAKERKKAELKAIYEELVEGKVPEVEQIVAPYLVTTENEKTATVLPIVDYDRLLSNLDTVDKLYRKYQELDDEEVLLLL